MALQQAHGVLDFSYIPYWAYISKPSQTSKHTDIPMASQAAGSQPLSAEWDPELDKMQSSFSRSSGQNRSIHDSQSSLTNTMPPPPLLPTTVNKQYVIWNKKKQDQFNAWWLNTSWGITVMAGDGAPFHPNWGTTKKSSNVWDHFHEVAHARSGEPKVSCQTCDKVFNHPNTKNTGTSTMGKHLKLDKCDSKKPRHQQLDVNYTQVCFNERSHDRW